MSGEEKKPKIELLQATPLYTVEVCGPIKEQLSKIEVCKPSIVIKPCGPLEKVKCIPDLVHCIPDTFCKPLIGPCKPVFCIPTIGPCMPVVGGPCGPWVEVPIERIDELATRVDKLTAEIEALKKKIGQR